MESIETDITQQDYDGLETRELRRQFAKDQYEESKTAAELRSLGQAVALKKTQQEEEERRRRAKERKQNKKKTDKEVFIEKELKELQKQLSPNEIQALVLDFVQVLLKITHHTSVVIKFLFPENYPQEVVLMELRSEFLDVELLEKLRKAGGAEAARLLGQMQVLPTINRIRSILQRNRLAPAFTELKQLKSYFKDKNCALKMADEKTGLLAVDMKCRKYYLNLELSVPVEYPAKPAEITKHESNLPKENLSLCLVTAQEKARHLAEFPELVEEIQSNRVGAGSGEQSKSEVLSQSQTLASRNRVSHLSAEAEETKQKTSEKRKQQKLNFISQPSLLPIIQLLLEDCLIPLASQQCLICKKNLLPSDPSLLSKVPRSMETLRLYCRHIYHFKCLEDYLSSPPFGKTCLHCGVKIQHSRLMTNEKVLEQRWTHQQARKREIEDVSEFMNL